jgi:diguanylate cyclase (GGDEF)-like protein
MTYALSSLHLVHGPADLTLTGLPNPKPSTGRLTQALRLARRTPAPHGVMFVDLDGFKRINDAWGHTSGDELLQRMAAR